MIENFAYLFLGVLSGFLLGYGFWFQVVKDTLRTCDLWKANCLAWKKLHHYYAKGDLL